MARKKTAGSTLAKDLGVTGFFGGVEVVNGVLEPESARELMLARIGDGDSELVSKCECCIVLSHLLGMPLVPQGRNGSAVKIRDSIREGSSACHIPSGRVTCCRATQAWNEGVTGSSARNGHPLTFKP